MCCFPFISGFGCSQKTALDFKNLFYGGTAPKDPYIETLNYKVDFTNKNLSTVFSYNTEENYAYNDVVKFFFNEGTYTSSLTVSPQKPTLPEGVSSDVFDSELITSKTMYYHLITRFEIVSNYEIFGKEPVSHNDVITQEIFFCDSSLSHAPIYSITESDYNIFSFQPDNSFTQNVKTKCETIYNQAKYTLNASYTLDDKTTQTKSNTYDYDFRTSIDNNQLLFALRNLDVANNGKAELPTISLNYETAQTISVHNKTITEDTFTITYNGSSFTEKLNYKEFNFSLKDINGSGATQTLYIQTTKNDNLNNKALPLVYEEPLIAYSSFSPMGTLRFTLVSITDK